MAVFALFLAVFRTIILKVQDDRRYAKQVLRACIFFSPTAGRLAHLWLISSFPMLEVWNAASARLNPACGVIYSFSVSLPS